MAGAGWLRSVQPLCPTLTHTLAARLFIAFWNRPRPTCGCFDLAEEESALLEGGRRAVLPLNPQRKASRAWERAIQQSCPLQFRGPHNRFSQKAQLPWDEPGPPPHQLLPFPFALFQAFHHSPQMSTAKRGSHAGRTPLSSCKVRRRRQRGSETDSATDGLRWVGSWLWQSPTDASCGLARSLGWSKPCPHCSLLLMQLRAAEAGACPGQAGRFCSRSGGRPSRREAE